MIFIRIERIRFCEITACSNDLIIIDRIQKLVGPMRPRCTQVLFVLELETRLFTEVVMVFDGLSWLWARVERTNET